MSRLSLFPKIDVARFIPAHYTVYRAMLIRTQNGENPHLPGPFIKFTLPRGTHPHCPYTDLHELLPSLTVLFKREGEPETTVHLFIDGTVKTQAEMHEEINRRKAKLQRLDAEENQFPELKQSSIRKEAYAAMEKRIRDLRDRDGMNIVAKQSMKERAQEDYEKILREQAEARLKAAKLRKG